MERRNFTKKIGLGLLATQALPAFATSSFFDSNNSRIPLGVANHSLRGMRPNAQQVIEYAIKHKLDSVQFNTLKPFESLEKSHLIKLKNLADDNDISIYVGVGSISEKSVRFSDSFGNAKELVQKGIHVASILESPILGVRIGVLDDRYTEGGIEPKIDEVVKLMKSFRKPVLDAGIKFAFENHAGDMRSEELLELIDKTGPDICGAFFDPGNAIYGMEDPKIAMQLLGKHILCCQARDVNIWSTEDGAMFQWTAVGQGIMDFKFFAEYLSENCPGVPIHLEIISNSPRAIPYLKPEYWNGFPNLKASGFMDFLKLVRQGLPMELDKPPTGMNKKEFDIQHQKKELLASIKYLRENCHVGLKN
jgi:3-oxoisoapionate decarboxylase